MRIFLLLLFISGQAGAVIQTSKSERMLPLRTVDLSTSLSSCLKRATKLDNPLSRDEARSECIKKKSKDLSLKKCMALAQRFEYSNFGENMKSLCLAKVSDQKKLGAKECFFWSKIFSYADQADEARWECFSRFHASLPKNSCLKEAREMRLPQNSSRAQEVCL